MLIQSCPKTSAAASIHAIICYTMSSSSLAKFSGTAGPPQHNTLFAHVYGMTNIYVGLVRLYAAANINNSPVYDLAMYTFAGALILYMSECLVWSTVRTRKVIFPLPNFGVGLGWMLLQRGWYLG